MLLLLRFVREVLQKLFTAGPAGCDHRHRYPASANRLQDVRDIIRPGPNDDDSQIGLFYEIVDHRVHRFAAQLWIDIESPTLKLLALIAEGKSGQETLSEAVAGMDNLGH